MTQPSSRSPAVELFVSRLLSVGTWTACAVIGCGIILQAAGYLNAASRFETFGVGAFVALPVLRLSALGIAFARSGERRFAGVCVMILVIIAVGTVAGVLGRIQH